jgi:hypothetical protein
VSGHLWPDDCAEIVADVPEGRVRVTASPADTDVVTLHTAALAASLG